MIELSGNLSMCSLNDILLSLAKLSSTVTDCDISIKRIKHASEKKNNFTGEVYLARRFSIKSLVMVPGLQISVYRLNHVLLSKLKISCISSEI